MAFADRVRCTTTTTGTGALTLASTGVRDSTFGDCFAPAEVLSELGNRIVSYHLQSGPSFAFGKGLISANGLTLTRDPFERSWNGTTYSVALLSVTGTTTVTITLDATDISAGSVGLSSAFARGVVTL